MNMMFSSSYRCIFALLTLALCSICISPAQAESPFKNPLGNPYIQDVIEASVESEKLEDALKQIRDIKEIGPNKKLSISPFHFRKQEDSDQKQEGGVLCMQCHLNLPHQENENLRTFLNMHTQFVDCLSCHYKDNDKSIHYAWFDEKLHLISSKKGGLEISSDKVGDETEENQSLIPESKAKIHPVYRENIVTLSLDDEFSKLLEQLWKSSNEEQKAGLKLRLHTPIKEKGLKCTDCHQDKQSQLDLEALGANSKQAFGIENNVIAKFLEKANKDDKRIRLQGLLE